jgi:TolA-binding protein
MQILARQSALLWALAAGLVFTAAGCSVSTGKRGITWIRNLSEATAKASRGKKLIIADMYTDWCGWCKVMDTKTWADPLVVQERDKYVFLKLNAETEPDGIALQKKLNIISYPTILLLNSNGSEFERLEGYLPAQQFLARLNGTIADPEALGNLLARESRDARDMALHFKVGRKLFTRGAYNEARPRFELIVRNDPENKAQVSDTALFFLALCQATLDETDASLATIDRLRKTYPSSKIVPEAQLLSSEILMRTGRRDRAKAQIQDFLKSYPDHRLASRAKQLLAKL